ncbi:MAG: hypothetical protein ACFFD4_20900, partial [Candidatus Odinarchaeota archaeon]
MAWNIIDSFNRYFIIITTMFQDLIERIRKFDEERGWNFFSASHSLIHLVEELGEVSRSILLLERYKAPKKDQNQSHLLEEL